MPRKRAGWTFVDVSSSAEVLKPVFFFFFGAHEHSQVFEDMN